VCAGAESITTGIKKKDSILKTADNVVNDVVNPSIRPRRWAAAAGRADSGGGGDSDSASAASSPTKQGEHDVGVQVNSRTHVPQKGSTGLTIYQSGVEFNCP
jgi:hypothetical protein